MTMQLSRADLVSRLADAQRRAADALAEMQAIALQLATLAPEPMPAPMVLPEAPVRPYLSIAEAAKLLGVSESKVKQAQTAGRLARYKVGSRTLVKREELVAWVETSKEAAA